MPFSVRDIYFLIIALRFTSSESVQKQVCNQSFSSKAFTIVIPRREKSNIFECKFNVEKNATEVCRLQLTFNQFQLPGSAPCKEQYLKIGERKVCGSIIGTQVFPFSTNATTIAYRGDGKHPVMIQILQERCKKKLTAANCDVTSSEKVTTISSPNYPYPYPTPLTCLYTIQSLPQETCQLAIRFIDFNVPYSTDCLKGRLLIDGEPYCGKKTGMTIFQNVTNSFSFDFSEGTGQGNGSFYVSVEKIMCQKQISNTSSVPESYFENGLFPGGLPLCCNRPFSASYFVLSSPGFLQSAANEINCIFQIFQASPRACRLRLTFVHFWVGQEDASYGCLNGFLEIDGQRFCGCKDGLIYETYFNTGVKEFRYNMIGGQAKQGFIIEVAQEDCFAKSGKSLPGGTTENPKNEVEIFATNSSSDVILKRFYMPEDISQCFQLDAKRWLEKIKLLAQSNANSLCPVPNLPIFNPINPIIPPRLPSFPPSYPINPIVPPSAPLPPISPPSYPINPIIPPLGLPPLRPPSYPVNPIIPPNAPLPPISPPSYPINPIAPPSAPYPPIFPPNRPINPIIPSPPQQPPINFPPIIVPPIVPPPFPLPPTPPRPQCALLTGLQGTIQSPRYPQGYPPSLKCCYKIRQAYGHCRLQLIVLDFDVAWSPQCWKDYMLLDGRARYCGHSLQSTTTYLKFRNNYASIDFVTSSLNIFGGRGFRAIYRQEPCNFSPFRRSSDFDDESCRREFTFPPKPFKPTTAKPPQWSPPSLYPPDNGFELDVPAE